MRRPETRLLAASLALCWLAAANHGCNRSKDEPAPPSSTSTAAPGPVGSAATSAPAAANAPPSPFSVVLESKSALAFSGLDGGVFIAEASRSRSAQALGDGDLAAGAMPEGLPEGPGRILRASGALPRSMWLSFEVQKDDGKAGATPLYRLTKGAWKRVAEDWQPLLAAWSKNRILAMSTSSGRLKIKLMDPSTDKAPSDMPGARLDDESCAKSLKLRALTALPTGEVFGAGNCKPGSAAGTRYVVIRWDPSAEPPDAGNGEDAAVAPAASPTASAAPAGSQGTAKATATPTATPAPSASASAAPAIASNAPGAPTAADSTGATDAGAPDDAGAAAGTEVEEDRIPGTVFVLPGVTQNLAHRSLVARSATFAAAAAIEGESKGAPVTRMFRFNGTTWSTEAPPEGAEPVRALSATSDGTLWMVTEHAIWKRVADGAWESVPPPSAAFPEPESTWEMLDVWAAGAGDVWVAARHASKSAERHVIIRLKAPKDVVRWP